MINNNLNIEIVGACEPNSCLDIMTSLCDSINNKH